MKFKYFFCVKVDIQISKMMTSYNNAKLSKLFSFTTLLFYFNSHVVSKLLQVTEFCYPQTEARKNCQNMGYEVINTFSYSESFSHVVIRVRHFNLGILTSTIYRYFVKIHSMFMHPQCIHEVQALIL